MVRRPGSGASARHAASSPCMVARDSGLRAEPWDASPSEPFEAGRASCRKATSSCAGFPGAARAVDPARIAPAGRREPETGAERGAFPACGAGSRGRGARGSRGPGARGSRGRGGRGSRGRGGRSSRAAVPPPLIRTLSGRGASDESQSAERRLVPRGAASRLTRCGRPAERRRSPSGPCEAQPGPTSARFAGRSSSAAAVQTPAATSGSSRARSSCRPTAPSSRPPSSSLLAIAPRATDR